MIYNLILAATLMGQTTVPETQVLIEEMLAHVYVTRGAEAMEKASEHFKSQSPSQVRVIYRIFKDKQAEYEENLAATRRALEQRAMNEAVLNRERAIAYKDHLKREFQITLQQKQAELEVLKTSNRYYMQNFRGNNFNNFNNFNNNNGYRNNYNRNYGYGRAYPQFRYFRPYR